MIAPTLMLGSRGLRAPGARPAIERFRDARVRRLVAHAYARVPYYRRLLDAHGIRPRHITGAAELALIPSTSRDELAAVDPVELVARGVDPDSLIPMRSSGSSGMPFTTRRTWMEQNLLHLFRLRAHWLLGWQPRWRVAYIRYVYGVHERDNKLIGRSLHRLGIARTTPLDMLLPPAELADRLRALRPDVVIGYPATLVRVAAELGPGGGHALGVRLVLSGAEMLTPELRRGISEGFGAPVRDLYGTSELNLIGWECPASGALHTCDDAVVAAVEAGELVTTGLHSFAMPFIRYRTGDLVRSGGARCTCGLPFGTIGGVEGRVNDYLALPDGRIVHPYAITSRIVRPLAPWLRQHQIVQERIDRVVVRIVPGGEVPAGATEALECAVGGFLGRGVRVLVEIVRELPREASGKVRAARSLVTAPATYAEAS